LPDGLPGTLLEEGRRSLPLDREIVLNEYERALWPYLVAGVEVKDIVVVGGTARTAAAVKTLTRQLRARLGLRSLLHLYQWAAKYPDPDDAAAAAPAAW
jgi:hypothetical protein